MSYNFSLYIDTGGPEPVCVESGLKYAYNVFYDAIDFNGIHNQMAGNMLPILRSALEKMEDNPEHYKIMNPSNGWGDYEGAMMVLRTLIDWAERHPKAKFEVS